MSYALILVYLLAAIISICLFSIVLLLGVLLLWAFRKNPDEIYEYLRNLIWGIFGGIIAFVLLELKGESLLNPYFYVFEIPMALGVCLIFALCGILYLFILKRVYLGIKFKNKKAVIKNMKEDKVKRVTLEEFFDRHKYTLLVLSIFLIVTITLALNPGKLNNVVALLSALITYVMLIGIHSKDEDRDSWQLVIFKILFPIFISTFAAWIILNIIITLTGSTEKAIWIIIGLIMIIFPSVKFWLGK
jgi:hypothetical protein